MEDHSKNLQSHIDELKRVISGKSDLETRLGEMEKNRIKILEEEHTETVSALEQKLQILQAENFDITEANRILGVEKQVIESSYQEALLDIEQREKKNTDLLSNIEELKAEYNENISQSESNYKEADNEINNLKIVIDNLEKQVIQTNIDRQDITITLEQYKNDCDILTKSLEKITKEKNTLEDLDTMQKQQIEDAKAEISTLENKLHQISAEKLDIDQTLSSEYNILNRKLSNMEKEKDNHITEIFQQQTLLDRKDDELDAEKSKNAVLAVTIKDKDDRIKVLEKTLINRNKLEGTKLNFDDTNNNMEIAGKLRNRMTILSEKLSNI
eukprot:TRINITY_DN11182_c0_g1_i1.p1 TRINITY_DN11182_c0_g1~~TRINITY_DN11182_c0_g1_i1.p1  ORF type:complete len:370 (+),score=115.98 TRINITY_DN11182_c0_g1_i1:129-1112(+)